ncbi:hypothetical protein SAMN05216559_3047 [Halomicrobium zhouii]|uniref:DUF7992 domain-containing protein n=1 Tax=Halomicrobium zhouii TaxID=767519 RepID=A0A1I6LSN0_9EURY|nr:hypothetical protein [Halomicrobium zhouii]SFS06497.1 hypothetical protein SAMN05216559_3047 [Halomicrobium zhouii]
MTLDVDAPEPPALDPAQDAADYDDADPGGSEYRREELESFLEDGAWEQAFEKWADDTDLSETAFDVVVDLELIGEFDFFWDAFATRVGYHAPGLPENWREREIHPDLDSWDTVSGINAAMAELGGVVSEVLEEEYVDWESEYDGPDDLPQFE